MKSVSEWIRESLESKIRPEIRTRPDLRELQASQWSQGFERLMRNRLIVGAMRYETFDEKRKGHRYDLLGSLRQRLELYEESRNQEHLVDCANLLMIEFECPTLDGAHFTSVDDGVHVQQS